MKKNCSKKLKNQHGLTGWWPIIILSGVVLAVLAANLFVYITEQVILRNTVAGKSYLGIWVEKDDGGAEEVIRETYLAEYNGEYLGEIETYTVPSWGSIRLADEEILKDYLEVEEFSVSSNQIAIVSDLDGGVALGDKILENVGDYTVVGRSPETFVIDDENARRLMDEINTRYREEYLEDYGMNEREDAFVPSVKKSVLKVVRFDDGWDAVEFIGSADGVNIQDLFGGEVAMYSNRSDIVWRMLVLGEVIVLMVTVVGVLIAHAKCCFDNC